MSVRAVLDALMPLLEPDVGRRNDSHARFVEITEADPDILYGWPRRERFDPEGTGQLDLERFFIRLAWATSAEVEIAGMSRDAATSALIYARVEEIAAWVRANRSHDVDGLPVWEHLQISEVDYESLTTTTVRGVFIDLEGYTLQS